MSKQSVVIEGVTYESRTAAAKALVANGVSLAEASRLTGMTYQTVYANTKGADKAAARRITYRILGLGESGRHAASEIAKRSGVSTSKVVSLLKKHNISIVKKSTESHKETVQPTVEKVEEIAAA